MQLKNYLLLSFASIFFPVFLVLFFIASVILFIKIASLTSVVQMSLVELSTLYLYTMPSMIFFVIPVSFFAAGLIALSKLSFEYELGILFSLGLNPLKIVKILFPLSLLVSLTLLVVSLVLVPLSNTAYRSFLENKKIDANINLKSGQFGQKFGDWLIFIEKYDEKNAEYNNVVLLHFSEENNVVFAKKAQLGNEEGVLVAHFTEGTLYRSKNTEKIDKITFETLIFRNVLSASAEGKDGIIAYWSEAFGENYSKKVRRNLNMSILVSLFPILSPFYWLWFGINNPRFNKNHSLFLVLVTAGAFYGLVYLSAQFFPFVGIMLVPLVWGVFGYFGFKHFKGKY